MEPADESAHRPTHRTWDGLGPGREMGRVQPLTVPRNGRFSGREPVRNPRGSGVAPPAGCLSGSAAIPGWSRARIRPRRETTPLVSGPKMVHPVFMRIYTYIRFRLRFGLTSRTYPRPTNVPEHRSGTTSRARIYGESGVASRWEIGHGEPVSPRARGGGNASPASNQRRNCSTTGKKSLNAKHGIPLLRQ